MSSKVLYLIESLGVHESRWLTSLRNHGLQVEVRTFETLEAQPLPSDHLVLTGPLTTAAKHLETLKEVSYVVMSYAYDLLLSEEIKGQSDQSIQELCFHSQGIVFDCEFVRSFFEQSAHFSKPSCVAAWGLDRAPQAGVDESFIQKVERLKAQYEGQTLIFSSRNFTPIHGVRDILQAFDQVSNAVLFIAGAGELEDEILAHIDRLSPQHPVEYLGSLTESELCYAYTQLADVYVSASHVDGISISLLQAMEANCVLVLSAVGGNNDLPASEFRHLFPAQDVEALGQALKKGQSASSQLPKNYWKPVLNHLGNWEINQKTVVSFLEARYQDLMTL